MKSEVFYFDSADGESRIHGVRYLPEGEEILAVVQIVHGMAEYVERYEEFARFLTKRGILVTGHDHLGHGKSVPAGGTYGYFCEKDAAKTVVADVHRLREITQGLYPQVPYLILGHSMGSFVLRNYLCSYGKGLSGAVIMGTGVQPPALLWFSGLLTGLQQSVFGSRHVASMVNVLAFGAYNRRIESPVTPFDWLTRDKGAVKRYVADPLCGFVFTINGFRTLFALIAGAQDPKKLRKMPEDLPILMVSGREDPVGDYGKGVEKAFRYLQEAGAEKVCLRLYESDRHEILNEEDKAAVMQDIYEWIKENIYG